jgi:hypothetical protein
MPPPESDTKGQATAFPPGHFYSPIPDHADLERRAAEIWRWKDAPGVDFRVAGQLALLETLTASLALPAWPLDRPHRDDGYYYANGMFPALDAEFLYAFLGHLRPQRMIEVGSGFSSLVTAEANRRLLQGLMSFTCIEPHPRDFLVRGVEGISALATARVEEADVATFDALGPGDVLFVDSSHVAKAGSDVNFIFFEVLPRLKRGVHVHFHDIFLPDEYPKPWLVDEGRSWNEQYLLHAFLMHTSAWEVVWSAHYMLSRHREAVERTFPDVARRGPGGSFWIRRA